ncbi:MAG: hypothetical protein AB8B85_17200 [Paracoccaceae bacterium]
MSNPEARLQIVVVDYLRWVLPSDATFWAVLNERKVNEKTGAFLNRMGRKKGVSDLMVLWRGTLICLELKLQTDSTYGTKRTNQTDDQKSWQGIVERCGAFYAVCRSTDDVAGSLRAFGVPIKEVARA